MCGWVKEFVTTGRVRNNPQIECNLSACLQVFHSQRLSDTPLKCGPIIEQDGQVCCAHCNCMAWLGEVCTHVAAVLFYLEAVNRIEGGRTCTYGQCAHILPSSLKSVQYLPVKDIDFTSARGKKQKLDDIIDGRDSPKEKSKEGIRSTNEELAQLLNNLSITGSKFVLSVVSEHSDTFLQCNCQLSHSLLLYFRSQSMLHLNTTFCLMYVKMFLLLLPLKRLRRLRPKRGNKQIPSFGLSTELEELLLPI